MLKLSICQFANLKCVYVLSTWFDASASDSIITHKCKHEWGDNEIIFIYFQTGLNSTLAWLGLTWIGWLHTKWECVLSYVLSKQNSCSVDILFKNSDCWMRPARHLFRLSIWFLSKWKSLDIISLGIYLFNCMPRTLHCNVERGKKQNKIYQLMYARFVMS